MKQRGMSCVIGSESLNTGCKGGVGGLQNCLVHFFLQRLRAWARCDLYTVIDQWEDISTINNSCMHNILYANDFE